MTLHVLIHSFLQILIWVVFIRCILSWVVPNMETHPNPIIRFFYDTTEPMLRPFRSVIRVGSVGLDLSPLILLLLLSLVARLI